jgi:hypothetical protein
VGGQTPLGSGLGKEFGADLSSPAALSLSSFFSSALDLKVFSRLRKRGSLFGC